MSGPVCPVPLPALGPRGPMVAMKHGAGGRAMRRLIQETLTVGLADLQPEGYGLSAMDDGAAFPLGDGRWIVITTDSHVVQPVFFPGGDIGRLSISGTVNDLAMMGATEPLGLTCGIILEEGYPLADLERIQRSMADACREAGAPIVTGDTKVMGHGEIDGVVLNTAGVGITTTLVRDCGMQPGDSIIVTGTIGDHGVALMCVRNKLELEGELVSDVAPINGLIRAALRAAPGAIVALKDPTRGGLASALHEMGQKSNVGVLIRERDVPVSEAVRSAAEMLGLDPFHIANEGKAVMAVRGAEETAAVLAALRAHPLGTNAAVIGTCTAEHIGQLVLDTGLGKRLVAEPEGELLPRIC